MADNKKSKKRNAGFRIKRWRRSLQVAIALAFILIPWLNSRHISFVYGNFLSFNLSGFPLADPLAVLQITLKNAYLSPDLMLSALVALGIALVLGTVFCSWMCPFGLLSDLGQSISRQWVPGKGKKTDRHSNSFIIKLIIFMSGLAGFFLFSTTPVLNQLSMPAWYSRIFQFIFVQKYLSLAILVLLLILTVEILIQKRLWCRYFCPQSVLLILVKQLNPRRLKVNFETEKCFHPQKGKEPCIKACNLGLDPKHLVHRLETECTNCADCIVACSRYGQALNFKFKRK